MRLAGRVGEDRILTVPNGLTVIRLLCLPLFVWLLTRSDRSGWLAAGLLLAALGVTDGVDGYVARHFGQVSTLGKVLDPLADRLLLGVAVVSIIVVGALPTWLAVTTLAARRWWRRGSWPSPPWAAGAWMCSGRGKPARSASCPRCRCS